MWVSAGAVVLVGLIAALVWFLLVPSSIATIAIGRWSCTSVDDQNPVEVIIGDGTFTAPERGMSGTWKIDHGQLQIPTFTSPEDPAFQAMAMTFANAPTTANPPRAGVAPMTATRGAQHVTNPFFSWSYQNGQFNLLQGPNGPPQTTCTKIS